MSITVREGRHGCGNKHSLHLKLKISVCAMHLVEHSQRAIVDDVTGSRGHAVMDRFLDVQSLPAYC